jgi:RNA polymerase subunit RPABC4/transcription elongation factor Spt4
MAKKLASKRTKELLSDVEIRDRGLPKGEFSQSWLGRITITNVEKSEIAKRIGIEKNGEYAIKVR